MPTSLAQTLTLLALLLPACAAGRPQTPIFTETFDEASSSGDWTVRGFRGDHVVEFAFDYSTLNVPPAPRSNGTTQGLRLLVNATDAVAQTDAVSLYRPVGTAGDDFALSFDLWLNYNGGPGGGSGSTQFATFGLGHSGANACTPENPASDGLWFAVSGEGGASEDYRAYRGPQALSAVAGGFAAGGQNHTAPFYQDLFSSPAFETAGAPGKQWVRVDVTQHDGVLQWRLNGRLVAIRLAEAVDGDQIMLGMMDTFSSIANPPGDVFALFDNVSVLQRDCDEDGVADAAHIASFADADCNADGRLDACETSEASDFDADGDVDADDQAALSAAWLGPDAPLTGDCAALTLAAFDANDDGALDLVDFASLQTRAKLANGIFATRASDAPTGSQFIAEAAPLSRAAREARIQQEVLGGNTPGFLRQFAPVSVSANIGGVWVHATYLVARDYVSVGRDDDFVRVPLTPQAAQSIADAVGCLLPTRKMVDDIWAAAALQLSPAPISPATVDITRVTTHFRHHEMIESQRGDGPLDVLIAGIKKDVVITPRLAANPGRVAIYGWHYPSGAPIQPLYLGHVDAYVDYSHGIRLVHERMTIDGATWLVAEVLAHPTLHVLLSDEGPISDPRY